MGTDEEIRSKLLGIKSIWSNKMIIRKAELIDAVKIAKVLVSSYNINGIEEGEAVFIEELEKKHFFIIAEEKDDIIGIISWFKHGTIKHQLAELSRIAILPEFRGKGISKKLFDFLLKDIQEFYNRKGFKLRKLFLQTHATNIKAQNLYKKLGFLHEATLKDHYYKGEDEMIFSMFFEND